MNDEKQQQAKHELADAILQGLKRYTSKGVVNGKVDALSFELVNRSKDHFLVIGRGAIHRADGKAEVGDNREIHDTLTDSFVTQLNTYLKLEGVPEIKKPISGITGYLVSPETMETLVPALEKAGIELKSPGKWTSGELINRMAKPPSAAGFGLAR